MKEADEGKSFEESMKRLEEIVSALEAPELSLEESMKLYREGILCSRNCREKLEKARHQLETWQAEEQGVDIASLNCDLSPEYLDDEEEES